jgi:iron complex outermembrane receptor protein
LETELKWNITRVNRFPSVSVIGNATLANYHFTDFVDQNKDYSGNNLPGTAKTTGLAMLNVNPTKNTGLRVWYRFTGEMAVNDANSAYSNPFGITNAELSYNGKRGVLNIALKGGIQNLLDVRYAGMLAINAPAFGTSLPRFYYPGNPRNFYVSVIIGLE